MGIRAVSGAIVAVLVLSFVPPSQAEEPPDATSLDVYADQHGCVMADQLVIHFDDGTTQVSEPDCVTADEAMPAGDGSNAGSKATKEPVFWFTSGRPNFVRSDLQGRFTAQRTMTKAIPSP